MLAELHCHTTYSRGTKIVHEGLNTPRQMVLHAKKLGIGILAVTDHDEIKGALEARKFGKKHGIMIIPSEEVSTASGHLIALGIEKKIPSGMSLEETLDEVHSQGGIAVAPHPFDLEKKGLRELARKCDVIEEFNALNIERVSNIKNRRFVKELGMPSVAGSDAHCIEMMGHGLTRLDATSVDSALKAIGTGKTEVVAKYIPAGVVLDWSVRRLKLSYSSVVDYINENYSWPKRPIARRLLGLVNRSPGNVDYFFRALAYLGLGSAMVYSAVRWKL